MTNIRKKKQKLHKIHQKKDSKTLLNVSKKALKEVLKLKPLASKIALILLSNLPKKQKIEALKKLYNKHSWRLQVQELQSLKVFKWIKHKKSYQIEADLLKEFQIDRKNPKTTPYEKIDWDKFLLLKPTAVKVFLTTLCSSKPLKKDGERCVALGTSDWKTRMGFEKKYRKFKKFKNRVVLPAIKMMIDTGIIEVIENRGYIKKKLKGQLFNLNRGGFCMKFAVKCAERKIFLGKSFDLNDLTNTQKAAYRKKVEIGVNRKDAYRFACMGREKQAALDRIIKDRLQANVIKNKAAYISRMIQQREWILSSVESSVNRCSSFDIDLLSGSRFSAF